MTGVRWGERVLARLEEFGTPASLAGGLEIFLSLAAEEPVDAPPGVSARLALATGYARFYRGSYREALEDYVRAEVLAVEVGDGVTAATARGARGSALHQLGDVVGSVRAWIRSTEQAQRFGAFDVQARYLNNLGWTFLQVGALDHAEDSLRKAQAVLEHAPADAVLMITGNTALSLMAQERWDEALEYFERTQQLYEHSERGVWPPVYIMHGAWAHALAAAGHHQRARELLESALREGEAATTWPARGLNLAYCARALWTLGDADRAKEVMEIAAQDAEEGGSATFSAQLHLELAEWSTPPGEEPTACARSARAAMGELRRTLELAADEGLRPFRAPGVDSQDLQVRLQLAEWNAELRQMAASLRDEVTATKRTLAGLAHDLRNNLTSIRLIAELSQLQGEEADPEDMQALVDAALQMQRILDGVRSPRAGSTCDLVEVVSISVSAHRVKAHVKGIRLVIDHPERLPCPLPEVAAARIVDNLLGNALKFSPPGGTVWLEATPGRLVVDDSGPGVSPEEREQIFVPFVRGAVRPTGGETSTGIGLAVVKEVAEAHGLRVGIEDAPGRGARFLVRWD